MNHSRVPTISDYMYVNVALEGAEAGLLAAQVRQKT